MTTRCNYSHTLTEKEKSLLLKPTVQIQKPGDVLQAYVDHTGSLITVDRPAEFKTTAKANAIVPVDGKIKWHLNEATITDDISKYKVVAQFQKAFDKWACPFYPIVFESSGSPKDSPIVINFAQNGDRYLPEPFDEDTLAYAFFPKRASLGIHSDMYFNDIYRWGEMHKPEMINLFKVVVHELGHAFGIDHNQILKDIMYPTYQPNNDVWFSKDTRNAVDHLYGNYKAILMEQIKSGEYVMRNGQ